MGYSASFLEGQNLVNMWAAASQDSNKLEECREKTKTLAKELASTQDDDRIKDIAEGILKAVKDHPEAEEQIAQLLARDIQQRGMPGIADKSASYYIFNDLIVALEAPRAPSVFRVITHLISNIFSQPEDILASPEIVCVKQLSKISLSAWYIKDIQGCPSQDTLYFDLVDSKFFGMTFERLPVAQWLDFAKGGQHLSNGVINAINNRGISVKSLGISNSAQLQAFLLLYGKELTNLNLEHCDFVTTKDLALVAESTPNLKKLNLYGCRSVDDTFINSLADKCPNLQFLNLGCCVWVTDTTICILAEKCPNLQSLNLTLCKQVTGTSIPNLLENCSNLQYLNLESTTVTDNNIRFLAEKPCPNLQLLNLSWCGGISDTTIGFLAEKCPTLNVFRRD